MGFLNNLIDNGIDRVMRSLTTIQLSGGSAAIPTTDTDYTTIGDFGLVLQKLARDFASGSAVIVDDSGNEVLSPSTTDRILLERFKAASWKGDYKQMMSRYITLLIKYGVANFQSDGTAYFLLENDNIRLERKSGNLSVLEATSLSDFYRRVEYRSAGGNTKPIPTEEFYQVFDLAFSDTDLRAFTRNGTNESVLETVKLAREALKNSYNRTALTMLSPKPSEKSGIASTGMFDRRQTDGSVNADRARMQEDLTLQNGAVTFLKKPYEAVDTNPDVGKLKCHDTLMLGKKDICNMLDYPYPLYAGDTKFDDAALHIAKYFSNLQTQADKLTGIATKMLGGDRKSEKTRLAIDYSATKEMMLSYYSQDDMSQNTTTQE